jgi:DNA-binding NtrC family response regulator
MAHEWPGNVRELENIIERAFILCNEEFIDIGHLPGELTARSASGHGPASMHATRDLLEAETIRTTLERHSYSRLAAAKELGMHKSTLFRKLKKLGISLPQRDGRSRPV